VVQAKETAPEIVIEVPEPWPLLNKWQRMHWSKRRRVCEQWSWWIRSTFGYGWARSTYDLPIQKCAIMAERYNGKSRQHIPDWDGLYGGMKPVLDALIPVSQKHPHGLGLIQDDSPLHIITLGAHPYLADEKGPRSVIRIMVLDGEVA